MVEKIKAQLKAKFPGVNLSKARIDAIADKLSQKITDESEIDSKLDELNELQPFQEIAKYDDWERSRSKKADTPKNDEPDEVKLTLAALQQKLQQLESAQKQRELHEALVKKATEKKLPVQLLKGRTIDSEDQLDVVLSEIEADHNAIKQSLIDDGFSKASAPVGGITTLKSDNIDQDIASWAKKD